MKYFNKAILIFLCFLPEMIIAQQKDSIKLICPLQEATIVPPSKSEIHYDETDLCVVIVSRPDTTVRAMGIGRITNVEYTEESGYGLVMFSRIKGKDYYFWFAGMKKLAVKRNDVVKIGQPLGFINPGDKIDLTMYEFETPVDPTLFLDCPILKRGF